MECVGEAFGVDKKVNDEEAKNVMVVKTVSNLAVNEKNNL